LRTSRAPRGTEDPAAIKSLSADDASAVAAYVKGLAGK
jgi:hypothetical protein